MNEIIEEKEFEFKEDESENSKDEEKLRKLKGKKYSGKYTRRNQEVSDHEVRCRGDKVRERFQRDPEGVTLEEIDPG